MMLIIYFMMVDNKLLVSTILKNMSSSMGRMTSHIWNGKIIQMFQTTNQRFFFNMFQRIGLGERLQKI